MTTTPFALEMLGYLASVLIAVSLLMRSIVRLRLINLTGAATFSVYGFLIGAYPVMFLNLLTASINVIQLVRLRRRKEIFRILEVRPESQYLKYFLEFEGHEVQSFLPEFRFDPESSKFALFVLRDLVPAGVFLGALEGGTLLVHLDYATAQYRDLKIGQYLFDDQADFFRSHGVNEIVSPSGSEGHAAYLQTMGFEADGDLFRLRLDSELTN